MFSHSNPLREAQPHSPLAATTDQTSSLEHYSQSTVLYFTNDSHDITADAMQKLLIFFDQLASTSWQPIVIAGHTDSSNTEDYNINLAKRRTQSVKALLTGLGYPGDYIIELAKGESQPVATNSTASGRQLNRRVEIQIK